MAWRVKTTERRAQTASSGRISAVHVTATSSLKAQALLPPWMSSVGNSSYTQMAKIQVHTGGGRLRIGLRFSMHSCAETKTFSALPAYMRLHMLANPQQYLSNILSPTPGLWPRRKLSSYETWISTGRCNIFGKQFLVFYLTKPHYKYQGL